jgi:diacylglycerol kinase (ATP)
VEVVAVNGGDGTIQTVLTALFRDQPYKQLPLLALLRAGTDSIIARDIGIRGSRERGLRKLLYWARTKDGKSVILKRPIMRVQTSSQPHPFFGMIFGAAAIYQGIRFCRRNIHTLGLHGELAPGLTLVRFLLGVIRKRRQYVTAVPVTIGLDQNSPLQDDFLLVLVSTLERFFLGIRPYWGTERRPLHFTAFSDRARHLLRVLPTMARGQGCRHRTPQNGYFSHNADEVRLKLNSGFTLDGELHTVKPRTEEIVINCGGHASFLRL